MTVQPVVVDAWLMASCRGARNGQTYRAAICCRTLISSHKAVAAPFSSHLVSLSQFSGYRYHRTVCENAECQKDACPSNETIF